MITGSVIDGRATIPVTFRLNNQPDFSIEFVIDTGFTGSLCLPPEAIAVLGLPFEYEIPANLANNSNVFLKVYQPLFDGMVKIERLMCLRLDVNRCWEWL